MNDERGPRRWVADQAQAKRPTFGVLVVVLLVVVAGCAPFEEGAGESSAASMFGGDPGGPSEGIPASALPAGELAVHFLDVGQGDATVVDAPDATMLIDTGRQDGGEVVAVSRTSASHALT